VEVQVEVEAEKDLDPIEVIEVRMVEAEALGRVVQIHAVVVEVVVEVLLHENRLQDGRKRS
jgi:hypothetical protein